MSSAFCCDLCAYCEPGEPLVRFKLESTEQSHKSEEWCDECLKSYQEWRESRKPLLDEEIPASALVPSVPVQGAYQ